MRDGRLFTAAADFRHHNPRCSVTVALAFASVENFILKTPYKFLIPRFNDSEQVDISNYPLHKCCFSQKA